MDASAPRAADATASPRTTGASSSPQPAAEPLVRAAIDGSKLILRLGSGAHVVAELPSRLLVGTEHLKITRLASKFTISSQSEKPQLAIIDGSTNHIFFPIHLDMYGIVYTVEGCSHVIVGNVTVCKVNNRAFPFKVCNKFVAPLASELINGGAVGNGENSSNRSSSSLKENQAGNELLLKNYRKNLQKNEIKHTVFLKGDESLTRLVLSNGEKLMIHSGRIIAWTAGISFTYRRCCCLKKVLAVQAENCGAVWIFNPYRYTTGTPIHKHGYSVN
ncbi:hypothetical protein IE077_002122 [Cardiosporidium cionae]|uniref:Altered inheritance of mitochondria protein 24, mitochondrial n=1 Tax=Cardiosporidium cionae TaxID=476202 RepID=A0ABQ7JBH5_9APIC|nr:hypothetical protein IE077_002122 [Cardiosporidium cionae]|eukprot:KAF8821360.1 hypothetical protein IE077_002122 [Cardiosporidium cionae]